MAFEILEKIGLNKRETEIYLCLLKEGSVTATEISRTTKIERTLVYRILEELIEKGFVTFHIENKGKKFSAVSPEKLLIEIEETKKELIDIMPLLKSLKKEKKEPNIEIYRGVKGVQSLIREILILKENYDVISNEIKSESMKYFFEQFTKELERLKIHERILIEEGITIPHISKTTKIRYLKKGEYKTTTAISKEKVVLVLWNEPFLAICIHNKNLAETYRSYFNLLWNVAKE